MRPLDTKKKKEKYLNDHPMSGIFFNYRKEIQKAEENVPQIWLVFLLNRPRRMFDPTLGILEAWKTDTGTIQATIAVAFRRGLCFVLREDDSADLHILAGFLIKF